MKPPFDQKDPASIERYAKKLVGHTLREHVKGAGPSLPGGKGDFGALLETLYFGIRTNNRSEPDFAEAGVEVKSTPVVRRGDRYKAKERLVLGMINFETVVSEVFEKSGLRRKNALLLLVAYLYEKDKELLDYLVKLATLWRFPESDLHIIRSDWEKIVGKIRAGKAHELSEGDTLYLGACTKGRDSRDTVRQPFSTVPAMKRAFCLKQSYLTEVLRGLLGEQDAEPAVRDAEALAKATFEDIILARMNRFVGKDVRDIARTLRMRLPSSKDRNAILARAMLGVSGKRVLELEKADVQMKTIELKENGMPAEQMSFPQFRYKGIAQESWLESGLLKELERRKLFVVFQRDGKKTILRKALFWTMPHEDIEQCRAVWLETVERIRTGRAADLPGIKDNPICHVRPHAQNSKDTDETPDGQKLVKKSFWLNSDYLKQQIS